MSEIDNERLSEPGSPPSPRTKRIRRLQLAKQRVKQDYHRSIPRIQRVPGILQENAEFAKYCTPKMISFGPIHHGEKNLQQGEDYKLLWTYAYLEEYSKQTNQATDQAAHSLFKTVQDNLVELKSLFTEDAIGKTTDEEFAWMLFVDGCSLLHFMENADKHHPEELNIKLGQMMYIWRDILMLENQLPRRLLELLIKEGPSLEYLMTNFKSMGDLQRARDLNAKHEKHYTDKKRTFLPLIAYTYFRAPWSIITFLHAIVAALILNSIQTWYTVHPKNP